MAQEQPDAILHMPVFSSYVLENGRLIRKAATYADISADALARFLMRGFGLSAADRKT